MADRYERWLLCLGIMNPFSGLLCKLNSPVVLYDSNMVLRQLQASMAEHVRPSARESHRDELPSLQDDVLLLLRDGQCRRDIF
jgi:hypothetical protein